MVLNKDEKRKSMKKNSFVFYDSFLEAMEFLTDEEFRECVLKIRDYAIEGVDIKSTSSNVNIIMAMAKPNLDAAKRRYVASVENGKKGAEFGKLGGAPKGNQNARKKQPLKQPLNVDVDVNENVNVEDNVKEEENGNNDIQTDLTNIQSFSNTSISSVENGNKDNECIKLEENNHSLQDVSQCKFNTSTYVSEVERNDTGLLNSNREFINKSPRSYSKTDNSVSLSLPNIEGGVSMSKYMEQIIFKNIRRLAEMQQKGKEYDKGILNKTIDDYIALYGLHDRKSAYKEIIQTIEEYNEAVRKMI